LRDEIYRACGGAFSERLLPVSLKSSQCPVKRLDEHGFSVLVSRSPWTDDIAVLEVVGESPSQILGMPLNPGRFDLSLEELLSSVNYFA